MERVQRDGLAARLLATFITELQDLLREGERHLTRLEVAPRDAEALKALFRVMHTLKGAARAAGVLPVELVCHHLESLLVEVRDGGRVLDPPGLSLLLSGLDALADAGDRMRSGQPLDSAPLADLGRRLETGMAAAAEPAPWAESVDLRAAAPAVTVAVAAAETPTLEPSPGPVRVELGRLDTLLTASTRLRVLGGRVAAHRETMTELSELATSARTAWRRLHRDLAPGASAPASGAGSEATEARLRRLDDLMRSLTQRVVRAADDARGVAGALSVSTDEIGLGVRALRLRPFRDAVEAMTRVARALASETGKEVRVEISGQSIEADRGLLDELREALLHLVRNAVDHGIEAPAVRESLGKARVGTVRIDASVMGDRLRVSVSDDGAGLDLEAIRGRLAGRGEAVPEDDREVARMLFRGGTSTRTHVDPISGRGVGLDAVRAAMARASGTVDVAWVPGGRTTFLLEAPVTLATVRALLVAAGSSIVAVPTAYVERVARVRVETLAVIDGRPVMSTVAAPAPLVRLSRLFGGRAEPAAAEGPVPVVLLVVGERRLALEVDELIAEEEVVVQPIRAAGRSAYRLASAVAMLASGQVAIVVNVPGLVSAGLELAPTEGIRPVARDAREERPRILVVDDSITTRTLEQSVLEAAGYEVLTAVDGADGWRVLQERSASLVVADVEMPRMDGFALCAAIRSSARFRQLPVILVTALESPEHRARGLEAGADAYLGKSSFDQENLLESVRRLLG